MTGEEFRKLMAAAGLSVRGAADLLEVAPGTVQRWRDEPEERSPIPAWAVRRLQERIGAAAPDQREAMTCDRALTDQSTSSDRLDTTAIRQRLAVVKGIPDDHTTWWWIGAYDAPALIAEVQRLRGLLKRLEWESSDYIESPACPACQGGQQGGHVSGCWLAAEIAP